MKRLLDTCTFLRIAAGARELSAASSAHGLTIVTPDERIRQYPVRSVW